MTDAKLDALLDGAEELIVILVNEATGERSQIRLRRADLASPARTRSVLRRAGCRPVLWSEDEHRDVLEALCRLADADRACAERRTGLRPGRHFDRALPRPRAAFWRPVVRLRGLRDRGSDRAGPTRRRPRP